jgi:hypothetical protein
MLLASDFIHVTADFWRDPEQKTALPWYNWGPETTRYRAVTCLLCIWQVPFFATAHPDCEFPLFPLFSSFLPGEYLETGSVHSIQKRSVTGIAFNPNHPGNVSSRDSAIGRATGYGLDDWRVGVRAPVGSIILSSLQGPVRLWGPPSRSLLPWG